MKDLRRAAAALVAAVALALAVGHFGVGLDVDGGLHGTARVAAVSRLHPVSPAARLRAAETGVAHHRPALAAVANATVAAIALLALGVADLLTRTPATNVRRRPAASRGPPR